MWFYRNQDYDGRGRDSWEMSLFVKCVPAGQDGRPIRRAVWLANMW